MLASTQLTAPGDVRLCVSPIWGTNPATVFDKCAAHVRTHKEDGRSLHLGPQARGGCQRHICRQRKVRRLRAEQRALYHSLRALQRVQPCTPCSRAASGP